MLEYSVDQKVHDIHGVKIGGVRGENPPVMVGSMFYKGHKIVDEHKKGTFHREKAEKVIQRMAETCVTGCYFGEPEWLQPVVLSETFPSLPTDI